MTNYANTPPMMTNEQFVVESKKMLKFIMDEYSKHFISPDIENLKEDEIEEIPSCGTCHGFLYYESGGNIEDCTSCNQTGLDLEPIFDSEGFSEFMEHTVIFGSQPFLELMYCDITKDETYYAKWKEYQSNLSIIDDDDLENLPF